MDFVEPSDTNESFETLASEVEVSSWAVECSEETVAILEGFFLDVHTHSVSTVEFVLVNEVLEEVEGVLSFLVSAELKL